ncbi:unnamed protein product [Boreogadus saida]
MGADFLTRRCAGACSLFQYRDSAPIPSSTLRSFIILNKGCLITEPDRDTPRALSSAKSWHELREDLESAGSRRAKPQQSGSASHILGWAAAAGAHGQLGVTMRRMLPINRSMQKSDAYAK